MSAKKKLIITGASGLLGHSLCRHFASRMDVTGLRHTHAVEVPGVLERDLDLLESNRLAQIFAELRPDFVIHTAGLTNVDQCQADPKLAHRLNVQATENVARASQQAGAKLLHISTDHLWDGRVPMVTEETRPLPINEYARSKLLAEEVATLSPGALILRTNFYGPGRPWRSSFSDWVVTSLRAGQTLTLFDDVFITPLASAHLCQLIEELMPLDARGIYHVAGSERVSKHELGLKVAARFGLPSTLIRKVSVESATLKAPRPHDMSLSTAKLARLLGHAPPGIDAGIATLS